MQLNSWHVSQSEFDTSVCNFSEILPGLLFILVNIWVCWLWLWMHHYGCILRNRHFMPICKHICVLWNSCHGIRCGDIKYFETFQIIYLFFLVFLVVFMAPRVFYFLVQHSEMFPVNCLGIFGKFCDLGSPHGRQSGIIPWSI